MTEKKKDWSAWEDWIEKNRPPKPEIKYNPNHKRTKGAEKRIRSFLRRRKTFILHTVSVEDNKTKEKKKTTDKKESSIAKTEKKENKK